jgi:superfamily II DNA or RNA helicase
VFSSLAPGEKVRIRDERWVVTSRTPGINAFVLNVRGLDRSNLGARASFLLPVEIVEHLAADRSPRRVSLRKWRHLTRAILTEATPTWPSLRTALRARISLLPFQLEPALAITHGTTSRVLIADEVGLGKTIQAALIVAEILGRTQHARVLIVAPASLKDQWRAELHDRFQIEAWVADSVSLARLGTEWGAGNPWTCWPVTITSIDFVKRPEVMRALEALVWDAIVFDEAHGLTGRSDRALAANALARRARTVVLLSATPHSGDVRAFETLCDIGDLEGKFPLLTFRRTRDDVGLAVSRKTLSLRVRPTLAEREMHRALQTYVRKVKDERGSVGDAAHLAMMVLTRRACSSASSLLRSVERRLALLTHDPAARSQLMLPLFESSGDEEPGAELAVAGLDDRDDECRRLERIRALAARAQAGESKMLALTRLLRRAHEPAIVFTEYRDTLVRLAALLESHRPVTLHGGLTPSERRENLHAFTAGATRVLLATDAASEGLNLHHRCRLVINLELPWTPLRLEQRIGRVERIGQSRRVHSVHLLASGTSEESFVARLSRRTAGATEATKALRNRPPAFASDRAMAEAEAIRIARLRRLCGGTAAGISDGRPLTALARKRPGSCTSLWGFHLAFANSAARHIWETVVGASTSSAAGAPIDSIEQIAESLGSMLDGSRERALVSLEVSLKAFAERAAARERAVARAIDDERARLSASLLQRGLFDRRAERALSAQTHVLDEALARCRSRLDDIESSRRLAAEPARLAFALLRR